MTKIKNTLWLLYCSCILDIRFLSFPLLPLSQKIIIITKKYSTICKHLVIPFTFGVSYTTVQSKKIYYDSRYGLTLFQAILVRHYKQLKTAEVQNINTVIDVGANTGYFTYLIHLLYPTATVHAIEPIPQTFKALQTFIADTANVKLHNKALSDKNGKIFMSTDPNNSAISYINQNGTQSVTSQTLDTFILENSISSIDLLKVDVESYEYHVLKAGPLALERTKYLLLEITLAENPHYTISSIMKLLCTEKYEYQLLSVINYPHISEGKVSMLDYLLVNTKYI